MECKNCGAIVPPENYSLHTLHCSRFLYRCDCGERVNFKDKDRHIKERHTVVKCECGMDMERYKIENHLAKECILTCDKCHKKVWRDMMEQHEKKECEERIVTCGICEMQMKASEHEAHERSCGSRTERCPQCGNFITLRDFETHVTTNCQYPITNDPVGLFNDTNGSNSTEESEDEIYVDIDAAGEGDAGLGLYVCSICQKDLGTFERLSLHMQNECSEEVM